MGTETNHTFEFVKHLAEELAEGNFDLPPFPDTALRVQESMQDPDVSIAKIANLVLSEPALTARLLRMANSAMLRRGPMEITDIKAAISRIGLDMVQNAAVSFAAREAFHAPAGSKLKDELDATRRHSIKVAALAYTLASKVKHLIKPDEAMLAGLLHTVGKFYILTRAEEFPELFSDAQALQDLLDQWHTSVARAIVESWGFPEQIAQAVDEYELIDRDKFMPADVTDFVLVANLLSQTSDGDQANLLEDIPSLSRLKMSPESVKTLIDESQEEISSMTQALSG